MLRGTLTPERVIGIETEGSDRRNNRVEVGATGDEEECIHVPETWTTKGKEVVRGRLNDEIKKDIV